MYLATSLLILHIAVTSCNFCHLCSALQSVHIGNMVVETEKSSRQSDKADRYQDVHPVQQQKGHSPVKHTDSPRKKSEQDSRPRVKPAGWTCGECLQWFPERDSYVSHVKTKHGKVRHRHSPMMGCVCTGSKKEKILKVCTLKGLRGVCSKKKSLVLMWMNFITHTC